MKKGFTLIELLAVIVILAIIAVIAVPIVLNIIDETKNNAGLRSAEMYLDAVEYAIANAYLYHGGLQDGEYTITPEGNLCKTALPCSEENTIKVEVTGEIPKSGTIVIENGQIVDKLSSDETKKTQLVLNEKTIVKNSAGDLVYNDEENAFVAGKLSSVCVEASEQKYTSEKLEPGYKYECKVDPNRDPYSFYVVSYNDSKGNIINDKSKAKSINLLMDQNINSDGTPAGLTGIKKNGNNVYNLVEWINVEDYGRLIPEGEEKCWRDEGCVLNDKGPITAMKFLQEATKNWTNLNEMVIDKFTNSDGETFGMETYTTYARLPRHDAAARDFNGSESFIYDNAEYGYWISTAVGTDEDKTEVVSVYNKDSGKIDTYIPNAEELGVRPIITLKLD